MQHSLAGRQLAAAVLFHKVPQGDDQFTDHQADQAPGCGALRVAPAQGGEHHRIGQVAHPVQLQFVVLGRAPGQALGQFVVIGGVEPAHRYLDENQGPQKVSHDGAPLGSARPVRGTGRSGE